MSSPIPYVQVVVAAKVDGAVVYQYGWAEASSSRDLQDEEIMTLGGDPFQSSRRYRHTTTIDWVGEVRTSYHYPGEQDFGKPPEVSAGPREIEA